MPQTGDPESLSGHRWAVHMPPAPAPPHGSTTTLHLPPRDGREADAGLQGESGAGSHLTAWNSLLQSLQCLPAPQTSKGDKGHPYCQKPKEAFTWPASPAYSKSNLEWKGIQPA